MKTVLLLLAAGALAAPDLAAAQYALRNAAPNATTPGAAARTAAANREAEQEAANQQALIPRWDTDLSGLWIVSSSLGGTAVKIDCNVLQLGAQLYGSCEPEAQGATPVALSGRINGSQASWAYDVQDQGRTAHLQYQASIVSNAAMNGTLTWAGAPSSFTAARK